MKTKKIKAIYDRPVDVLILTKGDPVPSEGEGLPDGVELDFSMDDGTPSGAKVIGFYKNHWEDRESSLAKILAEHLSISFDKSITSIRKAVENNIRVTSS